MATISFYFDEMMPRAPVKALEAAGYTITLAIDINMTGKDDSAHLKYATEHGLVVVTFDRPFAGRTSKAIHHNGLICLSGSQQDVGNIVRVLIEFGQNYTPEDVVDQVFWR